MEGKIRQLYDAGATYLTAAGRMREQETRRMAQAGG
jgi:hypothetical protein